MWRFLLLLAVISADASRYAPFPPHHWSRSPSCSSVCPEIYQPICALCTDGHESTFQNECQLGRHNSCDGVSRCSKLHDGECQPKCDIACPKIYQPVCVRCDNGEEATMANECELIRRNSCEPNNRCTKSHEGQCEAEAGCEINCAAIYLPVCAVCDDGQESTFGNDCELTRRNECEPDNQCTKLRDGACNEQQPSGPKPSQPRPSGPRPSGPRPSGPSGPRPLGPRSSGPRSSGPRPSGPRPSGPRPSGPRPSGPGPSHPRPSNPRPSEPWPYHPLLSLLEPYIPRYPDPRPSSPRHPGRPRDPRPSTPGSSSFSPKYVPEPFRPRAPGPRSTCPVACPAIYQPVCADCREAGEMSFLNICELEAANTCNPHDQCTKLRNGECAPPPPSDQPNDWGNDCDIICPFIYQPVCAQCPGEGERTFPSDCELSAYNSCNENPCTRQRDGECGTSTGGSPSPWSQSPQQENPWSQGTQPENPWSYGPQPENPWSYGPQPENPWSYGPQPENPWSYGPQPENPWSYGPQPENPWSYGPQPANPRPHGSQPSNPWSPGPRKGKPRPSGPWPSSPKPSNPWQSGLPPSSPAPCPMIACPFIYEPVCARMPDGSEVTFGNACELDAQNSCNPQNQPTLIYDGECRSVVVNPGGPMCPDACTADYRPVCAQCPSGRQTFGNQCSLQQHYCQTGEECIQLHEGSCEGEGCIRPCPLYDVPVCAICNDNRYRSFPNTCLMENYNCQNHDNCQNVSQGIGNMCPPKYPGLVLPPPNHSGPIPPPPPPPSCCHRVCPAIYQPVCARCVHGRLTFQNSCEMDSYNCQNNNECEKIRDGECSPQNPPGSPGHIKPAPHQPGRIPTLPPPRSGCDRLFCPAIYQPVCASCAHEAVTFENSCEMETYNCHNNNECEKTRDGECPTCPQVRCSTELIPICAQCGSEKRTFDNECMFNAYNCPAGFECTKVSNGTCEDAGPGPGPKPECPLRCTREYNPVCAQCPNGEQTFSTLCVLQQNNCQSKPGCTYLRDGECGSSSSCDKICPLYDIQICARCDNNVNRTFANPCVMDIYNCQNQDNCQYVSQGEGCPAGPGPDQPPNPPFPTDPAVCAAIDCSPAREPVCARCGPQQTLKTFNNGCMLDIHNCFNNQECRKTRDGACQESPEPVICPTQRDPVCAMTANGPRTFPNRCFLNSYQILNPQENSTLLYHGKCHTTCPLLNCLAVSEPICALCGFEQKTFENECWFNSYNCPAGYECTKISDGPCQSVPPLICTGEYRPVCATCSTGLETFANDCFMTAHNLANPDAQCVPNNEGPCSDTSACPLVKCPSTPAPVCGMCGNKKMTFTNDCQFRSFNCRSGYTCRVLGAGNC